MNTKNGFAEIKISYDTFQWLARWLIICWNLGYFPEEIIATIIFSPDVHLNEVFLK